MAKRALKLLLFAAALTAGAIPCSPTGYAAVVTWTFVDVKFNGPELRPTTMTGFVVFDRSKVSASDPDQLAFAVLDWAVLSSPVPPQSVHTPGLVQIRFGPTGHFDGDVAAFLIPGGKMRLDFMGSEGSSMALTLAQPLTDLGGTVNLIPSLTTFVYGPFDSFPLLSGKLVGIPIPEPTDGAFLAFGLVVLIASCARRKLDLRLSAGVAASMRALKQRNSRRS